VRRVGSSRPEYTASREVAGAHLGRYGPCAPYCVLNTGTNATEARVAGEDEELPEEGSNAQRGQWRRCGGSCRTAMQHLGIDAWICARAAPRQGLRRRPANAFVARGDWHRRGHGLRRLQAQPTWVPILFRGSCCHIGHSPRQEGTHLRRKGSTEGASLCALTWDLGPRPPAIVATVGISLDGSTEPVALFQRREALQVSAVQRSTRARGPAPTNFGGPCTDRPNGTRAGRYPRDSHCRRVNGDDMRPLAAVSTLASAERRAPSLRISTLLGRRRILPRPPRPAGKF